MPLIVYFAILGVAGMHLAHYYPLLPEKLTTHFDINGTPNGWMTRDGFAMFYIGFLAFTTGVFFGMTVLLKKFPKLTNIPNKAYWMAPERLAATLASLRNSMVVLGTFIGVWIIALHHLLISVCLAKKPSMDSTAVYCFMGVFIAVILGFVVWTCIRFRKPDASA